jgi:hypothetical protein
VFFIYFFSMAQQPHSGPGPPHDRGFTITLRHTSLGRTPLDEWSARRRDLYLIPHDTHKRQTSIPQRDSNPQSQQANGRRPTPETALPLWSAFISLLWCINRRGVCSVLYFYHPSLYITNLIVLEKGFHQLTVCYMLIGEALLMMNSWVGKC